MHTPALGDGDQRHVIPVHASLTIPHVALYQFEHLTGLFFDGAVASDEHWLFDRAAVPGQHVGDGDPAAEDALRVHVQVFGSPVCHTALRDGLPQSAVREMIPGTAASPAAALLLGVQLYCPRLQWRTNQLKAAEVTLYPATEIINSES